MLNSLEIRNYRNLKHLRIEKLGRVNLVIGKNNTGKSSLLEAVGIHVSEDEMWFMEKILRGSHTIVESHKKDVAGRVNAFKSIFYNENFSFFDRDTDITIRELDDAFYKTTIRLAKVDLHPEEEFYTGFEIVETKQVADKKRGLFDQFVIRKGNSYVRYDIEGGEFSSDDGYIPAWYSTPRLEKLQYVKSFDVERDENSSIFGKLTFTENEKHIKDALKLIHPQIEQFTYIMDENNKPKAVVKIKNIDGAKTLSEYGDGINRILTITLAIINCESGYLLIDEFENGLHYSVQEKLWEIIFQLAERLNVQVFATTHSNDAIRAFENVVNLNSENPAKGLLIKLDNIEGNIEATVFEPEELKFITDNFIEAR